MTMFELKCEAYLKENIELKDSFDILSKSISGSISFNKKLDEVVKNSIKDYCFGNFYPIEKDRIYKKDKTYKFVIRSINKELIDCLEFLLVKNINNNFLQVLNCEKKEIEQFFISELYSATPVIVSDRRDEKGKQLFWSLHYNGDMQTLQNRLHNNLEKKLRYFYSEELKESKSFIQEIELKNEKPQSIYFKTIKNKKEKIIRLIGNKLKIIPKRDETSQKLAFLSLAVGLGEKSGLGGGFCFGRG